MRSGSVAPLIPMVQPTNARQRNDFCFRRGPRSDRPEQGHVLFETEMRSVLVIIGDVLLGKVNRMALVEDDDVIKELSSTTANPTLRHAVLPRTSIRRSTRLCIHRSDELDNMGAENAVPVENEMLGSGLVGERIAKLLDDPSCRGVEGGIEMKDPTAVVVNDKETIQDAHGSRWDGEEVHRCDPVPMVAKKRHPSLQLSRFWRPSGHVPGDRRRRDDEP